MYQVEKVMVLVSLVGRTIVGMDQFVASVFLVHMLLDTMLYVIIVEKRKSFVNIAVQHGVFL